jgi:hypothetical protein
MRGYYRRPALSYRCSRVRSVERFLGISVESIGPHGLRLGLEPEKSQSPCVEATLARVPL